MLPTRRETILNSDWELKPVTGKMVPEIRAVI